MSESVSSVSSGVGNTRPPRVRGRKWCLTINNYTAEEYNSVSQVLSQFDYIVGKEIGEGGTPHLQIYFESKNQISFSTIKDWFPRAHIEKAKGSTDQNVKYCSKEGDFVTNITVKVDRRVALLNKYKDVEWKQWQRDVLDIVEGPVDDRTIHWFWETTGNVGKSFLAKYLVLKYDAIICSGKRDDVFNQVRTWLEANPDLLGPKLVVMDVPRCSGDYISYTAIESLKNGLLYSGKYEGGVCAFEAPHVVCLSNSEPQYSAMSADRWNVIKID